jgi:DNA helicase HerA-like ATPase
MGDDPIGKVTATERHPSSCSTARFWVREDEVIRPFDIVVIPHVKGSRSYGIVNNLEYITDSAGHLADYVSSDFGDVSANPYNRRLGTTIAQAEILYNTEGIEMPLRDGGRVEWADVEGIKAALGLKALRAPIPAGYIYTSNGTEIPVEFDADYLLGPEGAHLNIAGISGLATKTTYAMFVMNSIQQRLNTSVAMIIFNVKGADLTAIDEDSERPLSEPEQSEWRKCGLEPKPFAHVTYLYPFGKDANRGYTQSYVQPERLRRQRAGDQAWSYFYDVESAKRRLRLLFSDIDDPQDTMESIIGQVAARDYASWDAFRQDIRAGTRRGASSQQSGTVPVQSWRKFDRLLEARSDNQIFVDRTTVRVEEKRQVLVAEALEKLQPGSILVIDIAPLPGYLQSLVFGDVVESIHRSILEGEEGLDIAKVGKIVIFADELNKYAPKHSGKEKTLTNNLLEITERGRSLGVVLFGAEQFRSGVHDRILGNCSTNVFGRTSPLEVEKCPDYKYFPDAYKWAVQRLNQGELLLQHVVFRTSLIKVRFPVPAYFQPKPG